MGQSNARDAAGAFGYCFVLSWPLTIHGGVNQVVINLIRELKTRKDQKWKPLALELGWSFSRSEAVLPDGTQALYLALNSPYVKDKPFRSFIVFLLRLPVALLRLSRLARRHNVKVFNVHFPDLEAINFLLVARLPLISWESYPLTAWIGPSFCPSGAWHLELALADTIAPRGCCRVVLRGLERRRQLMLEPRCRAVTIHNGVDIPTFDSGIPADLLLAAPIRGKTCIDEHRLV